MKIPLVPPKFADLMNAASESGRLGLILQTAFESNNSQKNDSDYLHWDEILRRTPPQKINHEEWWLALQINRSRSRKATELLDASGKPFSYSHTDEIIRQLHRIDMDAGGSVAGPPDALTAENRDRYYISSLIEEAITSSQLEGASTTSDVAKEMLRSGRAPRDRSEQMIFNNFKTMRRIGELRDEELSRDLIFEIHRMVTENTLYRPDAAGRFRLTEEKIRVEDAEGNVLYTPPPAGELEKRLEAMCRFANDTDSELFVHPVLRAVILHFWLAFDHPFVDGNGRTARGLFYWKMLKSGYWMSEFISISPVIKKGPHRYGRAFLYSETDNNDLTYFIIYHLHVIGEALAALKEYLHRKAKEIREVRNRLRSSERFNSRQLALLAHALRNSQHLYSVDSHRTSHNVVYQTARTDLLELVKLGLLESKKIKRRIYYQPIGGFERKLANVK